MIFVLPHTVYCHAPCTATHCVLPCIMYCHTLCIACVRRRVRVPIPLLLHGLLNYFLGVDTYTRMVSRLDSDFRLHWRCEFITLRWRCEFIPCNARTGSGITRITSTCNIHTLYYCSWLLDHLTLYTVHLIVAPYY